jgi:hypothetical protein
VNPKGYGSDYLNLCAQGGGLFYPFSSYERSLTPVGKAAQVLLYAAFWPDAVSLLEG